MTLATPATQETREQMLARLREPLTPKQIAFCHIYATNNGNGVDAAKQAGYADQNSETANSVLNAIAVENLQKPLLRSYLEAITASDRAEKVAAASEVAERLTAILRGEIEAPVVTKDGVVDALPSHSDRIKAGELLSKIRGYLAPIKLDVTLEIKDAGLAWIGAVLSIVQAKFDLSDQEIEALLPELPAMKVGNRQEIKIIDME